jgi:hypothetical protein
LAIASKNTSSPEFLDVAEKHEHCCINFVPKQKKEDRGWEVTCCSRCKARAGKDDKCVPLSKIEEEMWTESQHDKLYDGEDVRH